MTWSDEVFANRTAVARAGVGARSSKAAVARRRRLAPQTHPAPPNSGLAPIAVVTGVVAGAIYWNRQGHKLQGRRLPPLLEKLRGIVMGGVGRTTGIAARPAAASPVAKTPKQSPGKAAQASPGKQQARSPDWKQQPARTMAALAAEQRQQQQQQEAAEEGGSSKKFWSKSKKNKSKNKKKK